MFVVIVVIVSISRKLNKHKSFCISFLFLIYSSTFVFYILLCHGLPLPRTQYLYDGSVGAVYESTADAAAAAIFTQFAIGSLPPTSSHSLPPPGNRAVLNTRPCLLTVVWLYISYTQLRHSEVFLDFFLPFAWLLRLNGCVRVCVFADVCTTNARRLFYWRVVVETAWMLPSEPPLPAWFPCLHSCHLLGLDFFLLRPLGWLVVSSSSWL